MTILELLTICKKHNMGVELRYIDFADCYEIKLTKGEYHVKKLMPLFELEKAFIDPSIVFYDALIGEFKKLGVDICE